MKFYQIKTRYNQNDINKIIMSMNSFETEYVQNLYKEISMVEYTDDNGFECMFAILDDFFLNKLIKIYHTYELKFELVDLTKDVIFDTHFRIKFDNCYGRSVQLDIIKLIKEYKNDWVTKDDILDKILDKGIDSLTDFDLDVLDS